MINYFIESTLCLTVLYAFYWLFLRSMKLLQINRFYLLMAVAFSLAIPALEISVRSTEVQAVQTWVGSTINSAQYQKIIKPASGGPDLLLIIYLTGCLVSLAFLVWRLLKIIRLIRLPKTKYHLLSAQRQDRALEKAQEAARLYPYSIMINTYRNKHLLEVDELTAWRVGWNLVEKEEYLRFKPVRRKRPPVPNQKNRILFDLSKKKKQKNPDQ